MNLRTIRTLAITSAVITGVVGAGATATHAASNETAARPNRITALITAIAKKFNLNQSDVQKIFDEQRTEMQQEAQLRRAEQLKEHLAQAVKDGKLTQTQADLLTTKLTELRSFHASLKHKTPDKVRVAKEAKKTELQQWAKANNIPEQYVLRPMAGHPRGEHGPRGNGRGGMRSGMRNAPGIAQNSTNNLR